MRPVNLETVKPGDDLACCTRNRWTQLQTWGKWCVVRTTKTQVLIENEHGAVRRIRKSDGAEVGSRDRSTSWYVWGPQHAEDNLAAKRHREAEKLIHEFAGRANRSIPRDVVDALLDLKPRLTELLNNIPSSRTY